VAGNCSVTTDITQLKTLQTIDFRLNIYSKGQATRKNSGSERS
jgi:hypothetical protein